MADVMEAPVEEQVTEGALEVVDTKPVRVKPRTKPLTEREEKQLFVLFATAEHAERLILLEAFEGKAHLVAGFSNFEEYCRGRLGLTYAASYLSSLVKAARFERQVTGRSFNTLKSGEAIEEKEIKKLPALRTILDITRVPDETKWVSVYDEYNSFRLGNSDSKPKTPDEQAAELKKIVNREVKAANPDTPRVGRKPGNGTKTAPVETEAVKKGNGTSSPANRTPIVGETYDGSEEQQGIENGSITYGEAKERLIKTESFVKTFVSLMSSGELNVEELNELYNDCTAYQAKYGL